MVSDKDLIKEFTLANLAQFQEWLDVEHDIEGSEAEDIIEKGLAMNNTVAVSALVNGLFINPHDCPILCNCGWRDDATKETWKFCGHYVGHQHINGNMITVSCNCPEVVALDSC